MSVQTVECSAPFAGQFVATIRQQPEPKHASTDGNQRACGLGDPHRRDSRVELSPPAPRARRLSFYTHPGTRDRIAVQPGVVRTAASASPEHALGIVGSGPLDAYLKSSDLQAIRDAFVMEERSERANVVFRVVEDQMWPFPEGAAVAPPAVVAVDLLESEDERSRRAGTELLQRL